MTKLVKFIKLYEIGEVDGVDKVHRTESGQSSWLDSRDGRINQRGQVLSRGAARQGEHKPAWACRPVGLFYRLCRPGPGPVGSPDTRTLSWPYYAGELITLHYTSQVCGRDAKSAGSFQKLQYGGQHFLGKSRKLT